MILGAYLVEITQLGLCNKNNLNEKRTLLILLPKAEHFFRLDGTFESIEPLILKELYVCLPKTARPENVW